MKVVEIIAKDNVFQLNNFAVKKIKEFTAVNNQSKLANESLPFFFTEQAFSTAEINLILSGSVLITKILNLPVVQHEELEKLIGWEVQNITAVPIKELVMDYEILEESGSKLKILVVIAAKKHFLKQINVLEEAGLQVSKVKAGPLLLKNLLDAELKRQKVAIIDIGAEETKLSIFKEGVFDFRRVLDLGSREITTAIQEKNNLTPREAEQLKHNRTFNRDFLAVILKKLVNRIALSVHYWEQTAGEIDLIYLTGGGSKLKGLKQFLTEELEMEVEMLTGLSKVKLAQNNYSFQLLKKKLPYLTVGLAGAL